MHKLNTCSRMQQHLKRDRGQSNSGIHAPKPCVFVHVHNCMCTHLQVCMCVCLCECTHTLGRTRGIIWLDMCTRRPAIWWQWAQLHADTHTHTPLTVATHSACVSPRENSAEPCTIPGGRKAACADTSLIWCWRRPSGLTPSRRTIARIA